MIKALGARPNAILFIDEIHSTVGAGATTGGTMDLATLIKPMLTAGELRVIGSTTFDEFKHIEKDRALARRLQKIAIDEPSIEEADPDPRRPAQAVRRASPRTYTDAALDAAVKLAARHLRDYRLPDSAIDLLDEAGSVARLAAAPAPAAVAASPGASVSTRPSLSRSSWTRRTSSRSSRASLASRRGRRPRPIASASARSKSRSRAWCSAKPMRFI